MTLNPAVMQAVEKLGYRVTIGDVASQAGLDIRLAERDVLALASEAGGHLQVAESGEVAYLFSRDFRGVLRNKYWRLRLQEWWDKVWGAIFYVIRISFGILLIASIVLIFVTILIILMAMNSNRENNDRRGGSFGGGMMFLPRIWFGPDLFWLFRPNYYGSRRSYSQRQPANRYGKHDENQMNFLEAVFSFLFGDGNPNADLEENRWQAIAAVIRNNSGAVAAEQIAPYLDHAGSGASDDDEDYILPVLTRFNGRPEVSPEGQIVYHFPELQVTAAQGRSKAVSAYLKEAEWKFSEASSNQRMMAIGLGAVNFVGALVLGSLLADGTIAQQLGGLVALVAAIYPILLVYGVAFLSVPLVRYFWLQQRNKKVVARNDQRQQRAIALNQAGEELQRKLGYAQQFAAETVVSEADLAYTTETDLTSQEAEQADKIDAEWRKRLEQSGQ